MQLKRLSRRVATMPVMRTPSVAQQRIVLVAFLVAIGAALGWQNANPGASYPVQKFLKTPLPDVVEQLDFTTAEAAWSSLQFDAHGNLKIDALTETALSEAIALIQGQTPGAPEARMALLLEKQFGATAREQILNLLPVLKTYKEAEQRWLLENGSSNPPPYGELFQLQDELLGKALAETLFSEQRRLASMMLASHQIRNDSRLTPTQKDQALIDLQKTYHETHAPAE